MRKITFTVRGGQKLSHPLPTKTRKAQQQERVKQHLKDKQGGKK